MKFIKNLCAYIAAPALALLLLTLFYHLWNVDLTKPVFGYGQDSLFHIFVVKTIINYGWFFQNDLVGFPHHGDSFYLYDFPIHADAFNFFVIKILAFFSHDSFFITNCFFILTFAFASLSSFVALRAFNISILSALLVSILYAFLPYHFLRNVWHLFLSNYSAIPLTIMVSLWIAQDKIQLISINQKNQYCLSPNRFFWISLLVALFAATNGIYYAFYSIILFIFAWFICAIREGKFLNHNLLTSLTLSLIIIFTLLALYIPSFIYWMHNGMNNFVANRHQSDSEYHALKIIDLFMPVSNHYLEYLRNLRAAFSEAVVGGERGAEGLGILAASGFMFLLLWIIAKTQNGENGFLQKTINKLSLSKSEENLISNLASLNLLSVLFATAGGLVMFIVLPFPLLRSHARFCIFIAFFSLFIIAIIFDKVAQKKLIAKITIVAVAVLALFDQVGDIKYARSEAIVKMQKNFDIDADFVKNVETNLAPNSQVFVLPVFGFPEDGGDEYESLVLYLHSKNIGWSYPSIMGRASSLWKKKIIKFEDKNFIKAVKEAGFSGVVIDRYHFARNEKNNDWSKLRKLELALKAVSKSQINSRDGRLVFFNL